MQKIIFASYLVLFFHAVGLATSINPALATVTITPDPIIVCEGETLTAKATVVPSDQYGRVTFATDDPSTATVTPLTATSGVTTLTIKGLKAGKTTLSGFVDKVKKTSVAVNVIGFEIEVNNTAATDDDYVQIKSELIELKDPKKDCKHIFTTPCQVKVTGYPPSDVAVTLVNSDDRLGFPTDQKITLTLPASGTWVAFSMTGQEKSKKVGDAKIELHHGGESDPVCKKQTATVFYFEGKLTLTSDTPYVLSQHPTLPDYFIFDPDFTNNHVAMTMSAEAALKPDMSNCSAPQISPWRIGLAQNLVGYYRNQITYTVDHINWLPSVPSQTTVSVNNEIVYNRTKVTPAQDTDAANDPFYTISTIQLPTNCGGGKSTDSDSPSLPVEKEKTLVVKDSKGTVLGSAVYRFKNCEIKRNWTTWCVAWEAGLDVVPLRQADWYVYAKSGNNSKAHVGGDGRAKSCPVTGPTYANKLTVTETLDYHGITFYRKP